MQFRTGLFLGTIFNENNGLGLIYVEKWHVPSSRTIKTTYYSLGPILSGALSGLFG